MATPAVPAAAHHGAREPIATVSATPTPTSTASAARFPVGAHGRRDRDEAGDDGDDADEQVAVGRARAARPPGHQLSSRRAAGAGA